MQGLTSKLKPPQTFFSQIINETQFNRKVHHAALIKGKAFCKKYWAYSHGLHIQTRLGSTGYWPFNWHSKMNEGPSYCTLYSNDHWNKRSLQVILFHIMYLIMSFIVLQNDQAYNFISMVHFTATGENKIGVDLVFV